MDDYKGGTLGGINWGPVFDFIGRTGSRVLDYYVNRAIAPQPIPPAPVIQLPTGTPGTGGAAAGNGFQGGTSTADVTKIAVLFGVGLLGYLLISRSEKRGRG